MNLQPFFTACFMDQHNNNRGSSITLFECKNFDEAEKKIKDTWQFIPKSNIDDNPDLDLYIYLVGENYETYTQLKKVSHKDVINYLNIKERL